MNKQVILIAGAWLFLCGFTTQEVPASALGQPKDERAAQESLPKSQDPMWKTLGKTIIKVDQKKGLFKASYPPEVKALVGKQVTLSGFMLPLEPSQKFKHFILSKRVPTCPYCPPGEPNEILDVWVEKPTAWNEELITVTGTFGLMNNAELGMFFKVTKAQIVIK